MRTGIFTTPKKNEDRTVTCLFNVCGNSNVILYGKPIKEIFVPKGINSMKFKKQTAAVMSLIFLTACGDTEGNREAVPASGISEAAVQTASGNAGTESSLTASGGLADTHKTALNSWDHVLQTSFEPIYENAGFMEISVSGTPDSYEELQEYMDSYEDISFVEYEIVSQYSAEEAFEKTGDDIFKYSTTLYRAHIYYDHLHCVPVDLTVDLAKAGMPDKQIRNDPPYAAGQKIIAALSGFNSTSCVAVPELVYYVYDINGVDIAYHVNCESIAVSDADFANLNMELADSESYLITTTDNNPVKFTQKSTVDDLTDFIRQDWEARGYDLFDMANFYYNARPSSNSDEDVPVAE